MRRFFVAAFIYFCASLNTALAADMVIDGSSLQAFDKSLSEMALDLSEQERTLFSQAVIKIGMMNIELGGVASREEARLKSRQQLSQVLNGKSYAQIMAMANNLPNDARFKAMVELETLEASEEFQHDADIERLKHLKYLTGMIEEYHQKMGRYPLADGTDIQNYVYIASPSQQRYTSISPPYEHKRTRLDNLIADLQSVLERQIIPPFDPQQKPMKKPNFYIYMTQKDRYFLTVYLHNGGSLGTKVGPDYYKLEISNIAIEERDVITYQQLLDNAEFNQRINEKYILKRPVNPEQAKLDL